MSRYFPEFLNVLSLDTQTSRYLLEHYFLPHNFLQMDIQQETVKYIPEIRIKYLKRQLKKRSYTKNVMACTSKLLQIIMSLAREERKYEPGLHPEIIHHCKQLDAEYKRNNRSKRSVVQYA